MQTKFFFGLMIMINVDMCMNKVHSVIAKRYSNAKQSYFVVYKPNKSGGYRVYFPDLPGCISGGDDFVMQTIICVKLISWG